MAEPRKAKEDVPAWEVLRNEFRGLDGLPCYEREFEPKTVGLNEATRAIACMTKTWFRRPLQKTVAIRSMARLR